MLHCENVGEIDIRITIPGSPVAKPRMTRRDVWQHRPCVVDYRMFKDRMRPVYLDAGFDPRTMTVLELDVRAFIAIPKSYSMRAKKQLMGRPHDKKPDASNILKAVEDALTEDDSKIHRVSLEKFWDDGQGERLEISMKVRQTV